MSEPTLFSSAGTAQQDVTRQTLSELAAAMSDAPAPIYQRVKQAIIGQIRAGVWKPHQRIPSESELVNEIGVSRMTINRALRELTSEGFLIRMQGVGLFYSQIVHYENNVPVQIEDRFVNPETAPDYLRQVLNKQTPYTYLMDIAPLTAGEHRVEAISASDEQRHLLQLEEHEPCLLIHRRTWSGSRVVTSARLYATVGDKKKLSLAALPPFRLWVRLTLIVYTR